MFNKSLLIIGLMLGCITWAQQPASSQDNREDEELTDSIYNSYFYFNDNDRLPTDVIELEPVYVFQGLRFGSYDEKLRYYILRRKTLKVYPYSKLASERLTILNERLGQIRSRSERKRYTRVVHRFLEEEFSEELKKLTRTEGQILIKLIHRQTGETAFDLVKDLRSGWRAFWYQNTARLFDISLKEEFSPETVEEDYLIEDILQRAFNEGKLVKQRSALNYDFVSLHNKWKDSTLIKK